MPLKALFLVSKCVGNQAADVPIYKKKKTSGFVNIFLRLFSFVVHLPSLIIGQRKLLLECSISLETCLD